MTHFLGWVLLTIVFSIPSLQAQEADTPESEIAVTDAPEDQAIRARLTAVLAALDEVDDVEVGVSAGVVTLSGNVPNARTSRELIAIAERVEGVVHVQNQLLEEVDLSSRVQPVRRRFQEIGASALQTLPVGLVALLTVTLFWFLGRWAGRRSAWLARIGLSDLATNLGMRILRLIITAIGVVIALEILDATALVGALLGVAGVAGVALGFAFRNIVENYLAGVLLSTRNPFDIGDLIEVDTFMGSVVRLTSRDTVLMTLEGNHLRIPNSVIITSALTNYTRNPLRSFEFSVGVSAECDLQNARQLAADTLREMDGILQDPGPLALIEKLGDSSVELRFIAWIDQRDTDFLKARSEAIRSVKETFDQACIEMPEPIYRVILHSAQAQESEDPRPFPRSNQEQTPAIDPVTRNANVDVRKDSTIDRQVAAELSSSKEENLLSKR